MLLKLSPTQKGYLALSATSILWGTTWVASKAAIEDIPALQMAAIRQFLSGSFFLSYFLLFKKMPLPTFRQFGFFLVMAILLFAMANGLSTWGLKHIPTGFASLIGAMYPICVVLMEKVFYKEKNTTTLTWVGMIIGLIGVLLIIGQLGLSEGWSSELLLGLGASVIAMLSWSAGSVLLARKQTGLNPYYAMGWQMWIGCLLTSGMVWLSGEHIPMDSVNANTWGLIFYLVIVGSIFAFIAFLYSLKNLPASLSSLYAYINPIVASITAAWLLNEKLTPSVMIGTVITLLGVYIVNKSVRE